MSYEPPTWDNVNFELESYTAPDAHLIEFEFDSSGFLSFVDTSNISEDISRYIGYNLEDTALVDSIINKKTTINFDESVAVSEKSANTRVKNFIDLIDVFDAKNKHFKRNFNDGVSTIEFAIKKGTYGFTELVTNSDSISKNTVYVCNDLIIIDDDISSVHFLPWGIDFINNTLRIGNLPLLSKYVYKDKFNINELNIITTDLLDGLDNIDVFLIFDDNSEMKLEEFGTIQIPSTTSLRYRMVNNSTVKEIPLFNNNGSSQFLEINYR